MFDGGVGDLTALRKFSYFIGLYNSKDKNTLFVLLLSGGNMVKCVQTGRLHQFRRVLYGTNC